MNDLVISGVGGGDEGIRGFIGAWNVATGKLAWRFWTVPKPGEKGSETWNGDAIGVGGGSTWLTGTYDEETGLLYWPTGNPFPDTDGTQRVGDNLYTNCDLALDPKTGELRWYFQFTPHDLHDWDAVQPPVLVDATFNGRARKLLLHANRNGYFYVLDRTNGELLLSKPFVKKLTWSDAIDGAGRPKVTSNNETTPGGVKTCPAVRGATNWYSTAFNPQTKLYYVMVVEDCSEYRKAKQGGFGFLDDPRDPAMKYLRALDIQTGKIAWEIPQVGPVRAQLLGRSGDVHGPGILRGEQRGVRRGGCEERENAVAFRRGQHLSRRRRSLIRLRGGNMWRSRRGRTSSRSLCRKRRRENTNMRHIWLAGIFSICVASAQQAPLPIQDLQVLRLWPGAAPGAQGNAESDIPQMTVVSSATQMRPT